MEVFNGNEDTHPRTEGKGRNIHQANQSCQKAEIQPQVTKNW